MQVPQKKDVPLFQWIHTATLCLKERRMRKWDYVGILQKSKLDYLDIVAPCKHNFVLIHLLSVYGLLSLKIFTLLPSGARLIHGGGYESA